MVPTNQPRIFNFGSLNIDYVYQVDTVVCPGQTITSSQLRRQAGGKGLNQSVALARAGAKVFHAGCIGEDGIWLKNYLSEQKVETRFVRQVNQSTGHAVIQVAEGGENAIVLYKGANHCLGAQDIEAAFALTNAGDFLLVQNETSYLSQIIKMGRTLGMKVVFNPAPYTEDLQDAPLTMVDYLILNETEGQALANETHPKKIIIKLSQKLPSTHIILTLGAEGVLYAGEGITFALSATKVAAVDTTAAGDCFIGYLLDSLSSDMPIKSAIERAMRAASVCITRQGAADSIPFAQEIRRT